jgi:hypothetical protein
MTRPISLSLLIAALLAAPGAFAQPVDPQDLEALVAQARTDLTDARCVLSDEDARCVTGR